MSSTTMSRYKSSGTPTPVFIHYCISQGWVSYYKPFKHEDNYEFLKREYEETLQLLGSFESCAAIGESFNNCFAISFSILGITPTTEQMEMLALFHKRAPYAYKAATVHQLINSIVKNPETENINLLLKIIDDPKNPTNTANQEDSSLQEVTNHRI